MMTRETARGDRPTLLITGSSGLIGQRLTRAFSPKYRVIGMDVRAPAELLEGTEHVECDLTRDESVKQAFDALRDLGGSRLAGAIHLAAYYDFTGAPSDLYDRLTVQGTRRLLSALKRLDGVEQLIFSSTVLVMKPVQNGALLDEDSPLRGEWDYPKSKIAAEKVIAEERGSIPAVILRIAGAYDEQGHSPPITQQVKRIYEKQLESFFFPGNAGARQAYVHLDDLVACFVAAVEARQRLSPWEVFLVAEPGAPTYRELQEQLGELIHGKEWPALRVPAPAAKVGAWLMEKTAPEGASFIKPWMIDLADESYPVSIERARQRLGWNPRRRLLDTLPEMVENLLDDPEGFYRENHLTASRRGFP